MRLSKILIAPLATAVAAALAMGTAHAKEFRSSDVHPLDYPTVQAVQYMGKLISERSGGKNSVKVFGQSTLGSEKDTIEQTEDRRARHDARQRGAVQQHRAGDDRPVAALPVQVEGAHAHVLDGPIGDEILAAMEAQGFIGLAFYDSGARSIYTANKPIKSLADIKDMKIRVQQSDLCVAMIAGDGRQSDADALWRGLHRAEDRHGRCRREQLAVLRILAPLRGRQDLQPDRALDGARGAGVLQGGVGHALQGGAGR